MTYLPSKDASRRANEARYRVNMLHDEVEDPQPLWDLEDDLQSVDDNGATELFLGDIEQRLGEIEGPPRNPNLHPDQFA